MKTIKLIAYFVLLASVVLELVRLYNREIEVKEINSIITNLSRQQNTTDDLKTAINFHSDTTQIDKIKRLNLKLAIIEETQQTLSNILQVDTKSKSIKFYQAGIAFSTQKLYLLDSLSSIKKSSIIDNAFNNIGNFKRTYHEDLMKYLIADKEYNKSIPYKFILLIVACISSGILIFYRNEIKVDKKASL